jgi:hypothetical protein
MNVVGMTLCWVGTLLILIEARKTAGSWGGGMSAPKWMGNVGMVIATVGTILQIVSSTIK